MASRSTAKPAHIWDGIWRSSFERTGHLIAGGAVLVCALVLGLALFSFDAADRSLTTAAGGETHNWLGAAGAGIASIALLVVGWAAWMLVPMLVRAGWRLIVGKDRVARESRLSVALIGMLLVAVALGVWENVASRGLTAGWGGMAGMLADQGADLALGDLAADSSWYARRGVALLLGGVGLWLWWRSLGLGAIRLPASWTARTQTDEAQDDDDHAPPHSAPSAPRRAVKPLRSSPPVISEPAAAP
ncbi:MAG: DNA translocase FtsK 4TM domain-containing protein, partial [Sphingopyxis sp.]